MDSGKDMAPTIGLFSKWRSGIMLILAILEAMLFGFILDGWPAFVYIFKTDRIFEYLCITDNTTDTTTRSNALNISTLGEMWEWANEHFSNSSNIDEADQGSFIDMGMDNDQFYNCAAQNNLFNSAVFFANFIAQGLSLLCGYLFDRFGLCISRILTTVFFLAGVLLFTFRNLAYSWFVFVGATLIALAGDMVIITSSHVALLVPTVQTTFIAMVCASVDLSAFVPALIQLAYIAGFSRANCMYVYAGVWIIHIINTAFVSPFFKIYSDTEDTTEDEPTEKDELIMPKDHNANTKSVKPFAHYAMKPLYVSHTIWISLVQLRFWFVVGSFYAWLEILTDMDHEEVTYYVLMYEFLHFLAIPFAIALGILSDVQKRIHEKQLNKREKELLMGSPALDDTWQRAKFVLPNLSMSVVAALVISVCSLVWSRSSAILVSVFTVALKAIMYMAHVDFVQKVYPPEHYGKAYGLSMTIGCLFDLVEVPLFSWAQVSSPPFRDTSITLLVLSVVSAAHPLLIWIMNKIKS